MSKFSYKTLLIIFLFLLIAIVVLWKFVLPKQQIKAAWWNDSWNYRQAINISYHNSLESNVYIITTVNIGTTTKAQIDGGDFRFIDQSGQNLDYYIASGVGTTNLTFHILIPSFPSGAQTIYAYYGNSTIENGFSSSDFVTQATNYTIGSISPEEAGGGPIAYWKFDEGVGTTVYDSSSNKLNGNLSGTTLPTWASENQCISEKCISFPGTNSNISVSDNNLLKPNQITISGWVKINESKNQYVINKGDGSGTGAGYNVYIYSNNRLAFWFYNGVGNLILIDTGANSIQLNNWYFFEATYNGVNSKIYLNGILKNTSPNTSGFTQKNSSLNINNNSFNGLIDEVKIYNYARTADQIKLDYNSRGSKNSSSVNLGIKSSTSPPLSSKLVAYYKFDEGSGTMVNNSVSGIGLSGSFGTGNYAPTWTEKIQCVSEKCLSFNGTQYLYAANNSIFNTTQEGFTYSAWINGNSFSNIYNMIMGHYLPYFSVTSSGNLFMSIKANGAQRILSGNTVLNTNKWYFVAATYDSQGYMKVYLNGKLDGTAGPFLTPVNYSSNLFIGKWSSADDIYKFNGLIDEVKIYNTALTADEIKQDYNSGSAIQFGSTNQTIGGTTTSLEYCIPGDTSYCASPVVEWNFEENTGTTVKDNSGNNNGTFGVGNSSPVWTVGKKNTGAGLKFDGVNDFVNINNNTSLNPGTGNFTVSMWLKVNSGATNYGILTKDFTTGYGVFYTPANNSIGLYVQSGTNANNISILNNYSKWIYVTWTVDNTNDITKSYLNGVFNNQTNYAIGDITNTSPLNIGKYSPGANHFNGETDDIRIYNYIRTPAQIAYDYNKGGPVGWWKLDECQGLTAFDASGLGNTGAIIIGSSGSQTSAGTCQVGTSAAWTNGASGKTNSSLNFDGTDDYLTTTSIPTSESFSISTWFKPGSSITDGQRIYWGNGTNRAILAYSGTSGNLQWYIQTSSSSTGYKISINKFKLNDWNHTVLIYNGSSVKLYINGILDPTTVSITGTSNASGFNFGTNYNKTANWFNGQIDDIRFYNYALTDEQIKQMYNGGAINFN